MLSAFTVGGRPAMVFDKPVANLLNSVQLQHIAVPELTDKISRQLSLWTASLPFFLCFFTLLIEPRKYFLGSFLGEHSTVAAVNFREQVR